MPLFKSNPEASNNANARHRTSSTSPARKGSIFSSRNRSVSPASTDRSRSNETPHRRNGFFGRRNSISSDDSSGHARTGSVRSSESRSGGGFFGMGHKNGIDRDPTILNAREKVTNAEAAEKDADRALLQAREMVKEAREHVKILEREAIEEYVILIHQIIEAVTEFSSSQCETRQGKAGRGKDSQQECERAWKTWMKDMRVEQARKTRLLYPYTQPSFMQH